MADRIVTYPVFVDDKGNEFVFPGMYNDPETGETVPWTRTQSLCFGLGVKRRTEDMEVEMIDNQMRFPHVVMDITHPNLFARTETYLIGGPQYREIEKESLYDPDLG